MLKKEKYFKLPIEYLKEKKEISNEIKSDLELVKTVNKETKPIYNILLNPKTQLGLDVINDWSKYYTTNTKYLKQSQDLVKNIDSIPFESHIINKMHESWREINGQNNFAEKYQFLEWERLKWLNYSTIFLTILSFYNISSPVIVSSYDPS